jgi:hypothetical protein
MIVLRVLFWSLVSKALACIDLNSTADLLVDVSKSRDEVVSHEARKNIDNTKNDFLKLRIFFILYFLSFKKN